MDEAKEVAPFTGAWIEISKSNKDQHKIWSLPLRERGLKSLPRSSKSYTDTVAPFTGAWIEICP